MHLLLFIMKTLSAYISESILSSSGAGKAKVEAEYKKYKLNPDKVTMNPDGTIDYDGDVHLSELGLTAIPFKFNRVKGDFSCGGNHLTSLEGAPRVVSGDFRCSDNQLTSLEGGPQVVTGDFSCMANNIVSLKGCPSSLGGYLWCDENHITSLEGLPADLEHLAVPHNELTSFKGCPKTLKKINASYNHITSLEGLPKTMDMCIVIYNNLTNLKGSPSIIKDRFDVSYNPVQSYSEGPKRIVSAYGVYGCATDEKLDAEQRHRKHNEIIQHTKLDRNAKIND